MTGFVWAVLGVLGTLATTALGDMVSEEVRDRLDRLPHAILRLAALWLDPALRVTTYEDEWLPELAYILKGDDARPVTRLYHGTRYSIGILASTRCIVRNLQRPEEDNRVNLGEPDMVGPDGTYHYVKPHIRRTGTGAVTRVSGHYVRHRHS